MRTEWRKELARGKAIPGAQGLLVGALHGNHPIDIPDAFDDLDAFRVRGAGRLAPMGVEFIRRDADDQGVAQAPETLQQGEMADVKQIERTIRQHDFFHEMRRFLRQGHDHCLAEALRGRWSGTEGSESF